MKNTLTFEQLSTDSVLDEKELLAITQLIYDTDPYIYPAMCSAADAEKMLTEFSDGKLVSKTRYFIPAGKHTWEVDIFEGDNAPLAVAEIELASEEETFELPDWITSEVTGDKRYNNTYLAEHQTHALCVTEKLSLSHLLNTCKN